MAEFGQISRRIEGENSPLAPIVFLNSEEEVIYVEIYHPEMEVLHLRRDPLGVGVFTIPYVRFPIGEDEVAKAFAAEVNEKVAK